MSEIAAEVCEKCGCPVQKGDRYCRRCGSAIAEEEGLSAAIARMQQGVGECLRQYEPEAEAESDEALRQELERLRAELAALRAESARTQAGVVDAGAYAAPAGGYPRTEEHPRVPASAKGSRRAPSRNRIFISCICAAMLLLSLGLCCAPWLNGADSFTGLEALVNLFGGGYGAAFSRYIDVTVSEHIFARNQLISDICLALSKQVLRIGIPAYILALLFGLPVFLSAFGRVRLAGWHRCFAWVAFLVSVLLGLVFLGVGGAESISVWFILGGVANLLRAVLLIFYDNRPKFWGGLER